MTEGEYDLFARKEYYRGVINYEGILGAHINRIAMYRDSDLKRYCSSIETLILMLPLELRSMSLQYLAQLGLRRGSYLGLTEEKLQRYDELWVYINEILEKNNMIFKAGSFEIGHD